MDINFLTYCEASQPEDVEGCCVFRYAQYFLKWVQSGLFLQYEQYTQLYKKFKARQVWSLYRDITLRKQRGLLMKKSKVPAVRILWEIPLISQIHLTVQRRPNTLLTRYEPGILCRGETQGVQRCFFSCACWPPLHTAASPPPPSLLLFPWPCAECWHKLGGGRRVRGREGVRKWKREKEVGKVKKTLKPLVIFSNKSWHPVFVASASPIFWFRVAKAKATCRLSPSAPAEQD